jgi:hypothetical protein
MSRLPLYTIGLQIAVRLSALRAGHLLPTERFLILMYVTGFADLKAIMGLLLIDGNK